MGVWGTFALLVVLIVGIVAVYRLFVKWGSMGGGVVDDTPEIREEIKILGEKHMVEHYRYRLQHGLTLAECSEATKEFIAKHPEVWEVSVENLDD